MIYCSKCGAQMDDQAKFCPDCGAPQQGGAHYGEVVTHQGHVAGGSVSFTQAFVLLFTRFKDFGGRSRRSEYWWANLAITIVSTVLSLIVAELSWVWTVIVFVPSLSLNIRRLHDIGKSGWWYLINFVPIVGQIIYLIFMCKDSTGDNQWGYNPKA